MRRVSILILTVVGCSGSGSAHDMTVPADMSVFGSFTCPSSIADYCQTRMCPPDVAAAESPCGMDMGHAPMIETETCGPYVIVDVSGIDTEASWVYDATTGELVALLGVDNLDPEMCFAGPSQLTIPQCGQQTVVCYRR